jgi:hypothetical protein
MKKSGKLYKILVFGVVICLIGLASTPCIAAIISKQNITKSEFTEVTCGISTPDGIISIEKQISIEEAEKISELISAAHKAFKILDDLSSSFLERKEANTTILTAVSKLRKHELIPQFMTDSEVRDVMNGEYGKKVYEKLMKKLNLQCSSSNINKNGDWKHNALGVVYWEGGGEEAMHFLSTLPLDFLLSIVPFVKNAGLQAVLWLLILVFLIPQFLPKCIIPYAYGYIMPWLGGSGCIKTVGLLGKWGLFTGDFTGEIMVNMIGGIGLWFINRAMGIISQQYIGFALYVGAKETGEKLNFC